MLWADPNSAQSIHAEIAYCNREMSKLDQEMFQLNTDKTHIDTRLLACQSAIERYKQQLRGAYEAKERVYSR